MMKRMLGLAGLLLLLAGCVRSLNPLYTDQDVIFEPALAGTWLDNDSNTWVFTQSGSNPAYRVVYTDKGRAGEFDVRLCRLAGERFLDFYPRDSELKQNDFYQFHLLPVHTFARVTVASNQLRMAFMNPDWLKQFLKEHTNAVRHAVVDDNNIVLTAPTLELQAFVLQHAKTGKAFNDPASLTRKTP